LPAEFPAILTFDDGHKERVMVPADIHPATLVLPRDFASGDFPGGKK
jgi:hypothetical protein